VAERERDEGAIGSGLSAGGVANEEAVAAVVVGAADADSVAAGGVAKL